MADFRVNKAHDGLKVGDIKSLPSSPVTDYMVKHGYWEEIVPKSTKSQKRKK